MSVYPKQGGSRATYDKFQNHTLTLILSVLPHLGSTQEAGTFWYLKHFSKNSPEKIVIRTRKIALYFE